MLKVTCYNSLCQLLEILFLSWYIRGMTVLCVLVIILASHIYTLGYLLGHLPSKASPLVLLFLSLGVLLLCFLPLLGLLGALRFLSPIILTMLWLRFLLPALASTPLTPMRLSSVSLASIILR